MVNPLKDATYNETTHELKFKWQGPGGESDYMLVLEGDKFKGERKLPDDGGVMTYSGAKATAKVAEAEPEKPKGPSLDERVLKAGPAGYISSAGAELVSTSGIGGWRDLTVEKISKDVEVTVRRSDYDYMNSRLADGGTVYAEFNLQHTFTKGPIPVYDTVADIKGTTWPDEVVIISAHWTPGTARAPRAAPTTARARQSRSRPPASSPPPRPGPSAPSASSSGPARSRDSWAPGRT
jgi:hypothetical protein